MLLGNRSWMHENGLALSAAQEAEVAALESQGNTVVLAALGLVDVGREGREGGGGKEGSGAEGNSSQLELSGALAVSDSLKPDAYAVVRQLRSSGLDVWMISGDNQRTAVHIAREAGLEPEFVVAGVKPDGKLAKVQELRDAGAKIAFVGDGINDAPALAAADVVCATGFEAGAARMAS